jgi:hypothetical protein
MPGVAERRSFDYARAGTTDLLAALDLASGALAAPRVSLLRCEPLPGYNSDFCRRGPGPPNCSAVGSEELFDLVDRCLLLRHELFELLDFGPRLIASGM